MAGSGNPTPTSGARRMVRAALSLIAVALALALFPRPAEAHESQTLAGYAFTVGWGVEPQYVGQLNSIVMTVTDPQGRPVEGLADSLHIQAIYAQQRLTLPLEPIPVAQGAQSLGYEAPILPTQPGPYSVVISGMVGGSAVAGTFAIEDVGEAAAVEFPTQVPSLADLATAQQRQLDRIGAVRTDADTARAVGIAGIVVGTGGIILAGAAMIAVRRAATAWSRRTDSGHPQG